MKLQSDKGPRLSVRRAFVVQLHVEADIERGRVMGRVEHVVSGQATHFGTLEELLVFMARVLAEGPARP